jgi:putative ABC transport system permease protein
MNLYALVWRNSFRKKARFTLTWLSVVVAFFLFTTLAGINHALTASINSDNSLRLMTSHKVSMTRSLPINFQQKIQSLDGIEQVTYASWFGGYFKNEQNQLAVTAVEHNSYFAIFDEYIISPQQLKNWQVTRTGIIIGQEVADKYHWKIGDTVPLSSSIWMNRDGLFTWQFIVSAIYQTKDRATDAKKIFFQHKYFDRARGYSQNSVSWLSSKIKTTANVEQVIQQLDEKFANSSSPTRTITEQVFIKEQAQQFVDMAMVIKVVLSAVFFTLLLIVCNTMIQVARERLSETAMMKALGFSSLALIKQIYLEALLLLGLGAFTGSLLASLLLSQVQAQMMEFLPGISITIEHYLQVLAFVGLAAVICSLFPALTINRLSISSNLGAKS